MTLSEALSWYRNRFRPNVIVSGKVHDAGRLDSFSDHEIVVDGRKISAEDIERISLTFLGTQFSQPEMGELDGTGNEGASLMPVTYSDSFVRLPNGEWKTDEA